MADGFYMFLNDIISGTFITKWSPQPTKKSFYLIKHKIIRCFLLKVGASFLSLYQDFKNLLPSHIPTIQIAYIVIYEKKFWAIFV